MGKAKSQTERNEAAKRKKKIISAVQWVLAIIVMIVILYSRFTGCWYLL